MEPARQHNNAQLQYLLDSAHINASHEKLTVAKQPDKSRGRRWCCAVCKTYVTDEGSVIRIDGTSEHFKMNSHGQAFQFRSFLHADGCARAGLPTEEHTWYTGYLWQFAHCARCKIQLGWYFTGANPFFGLINQQLTRCADDKPL